MTSGPSAPIGSTPPDPATLAARMAASTSSSVTSRARSARASTTTCISFGLPPMRTTWATPSSARSRGQTTVSAISRRRVASVVPDLLRSPTWSTCPMMLEIGAISGSTPGGQLRPRRGELLLHDLAVAEDLGLPAELDPDDREARARSTSARA